MTSRLRLANCCRLDSLSTYRTWRDRAPIRFHAISCILIPRMLFSGRWKFCGRARTVRPRRLHEERVRINVSLSASRYGRIFHAVWSGTAARLLTTAVTLISLPLAVRYLGAERYGLWATITTTVVWINLLDLGIANTLTNHISRAYALDDKHSAAGYFTNALILTAGIAALAGLAFAVVFPRINWVRLFNVNASVNPAELKHVIAAAVGLMLLGLPCSLASKLLAGYQELHRNSYAICAGAVASVVGLALGITLQVSMPVLFVMSLGCLPLANLANLVSVVTWQKPGCFPVRRLSAARRSGNC